MKETEEVIEACRRARRTKKFRINVEYREWGRIQLLFPEYELEESPGPSPTPPPPTSYTVCNRKTRTPH
jgi:hypothetical protein